MRDWANESFQAVRTPSVGYCVLDEKTRCWYDESKHRFGDGYKEKRVTVDAAYLDAAKRIVQNRLQRGGVRLGALLNQIFDPQDYQ